MVIYQQKMIMRKKRCKKCKMYGVVTKYFNDRGYGFIQCASDGEIYFLHKKDLNGEHIESGYHVFFVKFETKRRNNNAAILNVIETPERI